MIPEEAYEGAERTEFSHLVAARLFVLARSTFSDCYKLPALAANQRVESFSRRKQKRANNRQRSTDALLTRI